MCRIQIHSVRVHSAKHTHTHTKRTPPLRGNRHPREWKMCFCPLCARSKTCRALAGRLLADFAGSGKAHGEHKVAFICACSRSVRKHREQRETRRLSVLDHTGAHTHTRAPKDAQKNAQQLHKKTNEHAARHKTEIRFHKAYNINSV